MVGMRDMINRVMKTFPGLAPTNYMKVIVFGCQVIGKCFAFIVSLEIFAKMYFMLSSGLQLNLYAMDTRTTGIYRFGTID